MTRRPSSVASSSTSVPPPAAVTINPSSSPTKPHRNNTKNAHRRHHHRPPLLRTSTTGPDNHTDWRLGKPCHWIEQSRFLFRKSLAMRFFSFAQLIAGLIYLQYRARSTIGKFDSSRHPAVLTYQILFFVLECISLGAVLFRLYETWNITYRNCIDFSRIPNHMLAPISASAVPAPPTATCTTGMSTSSESSSEGSTGSPQQQQQQGMYVGRKPPQYSNYPTVAVFIPCYNEDVDLVTETLIAALQLDYPRQLLSVYLCDDGKDMAKRQVVSQLRHQYSNINYVVRPQHLHAKAGNLNYAIRRTQSDLIVTLDADFVARPNLLNRLLPFYYVWNKRTGLYEFDHSLAFVQTPQFYRNLSPYDADALDQRSIFFFDIVMAGKDWFNASSMVGTTNLISRRALERAGYYPYHSITEDTALSIMFHGLGYHSYYSKESLATGLATESLWANLRQRARWLKGDWQILFSRHGPMSQSGLSFPQRMLYLNMAFARLISVVHLLYDFAIVVLLTFHLSPLDARQPVEFVAYLAAYIVMGLLHHYASSFGGGGLDKSEAANVAFEAIFRYTTVKGLFIALLRGDKLKFKVTDKPGRSRRNSATTNNGSLASSRGGVGGGGGNGQQRVCHTGNNGGTAMSNTSCSTYSQSQQQSSVSVALLRQQQQQQQRERFVDPRNRGTVLGQLGPGLHSYGLELVPMSSSSMTQPNTTAAASIDRVRDRARQAAATTGSPRHPSSRTHSRNPSQGSTPLHSRRPSSATSRNDAQDVSVGTVADESQQQQYHDDFRHQQHNDAATDYVVAYDDNANQQHYQVVDDDGLIISIPTTPAEVINMPPPVATLPTIRPIINNNNNGLSARPPPYPGSSRRRSSVEFEQQTTSLLPQQQQHYHHDELIYDDVNSSSATPHADNNGSVSVIVHPNFVSPPMTRTQTNQMGAMSADDDVGNTVQTSANNVTPSTTITTTTATVNVPPYAGQQQQRPLTVGADIQHHYANAVSQGDGSVGSVSLSGSATQPSTHIPPFAPPSCTDTGNTTVLFDHSSVAVPKQPHTNNYPVANMVGTTTHLPYPRRDTLRSGSRSSSECEYAHSDTTDGRGNWITKKKPLDPSSGVPVDTPPSERRRVTIRKNLKRTWFNSFIVILLVYAIVWGILYPPPDRSENLGNGKLLIHDNLLPTGLALGFALCNLLPHLLALYLCFIPYLSGWMMTDLRYGRCDQWTVHPKTGKLFVPFSFISLLSVARVVIIVGAVTVTIVASLSSGSKIVDVNR